MTNLPIEMLYERIHLRSLRAPEGHWYCLADEDEVDLSKATHIVNAFDPDDPTHTPTHILFRYTCSDGRNRILCLPIDNEPEPTAEDLAEWQAASSGCGYHTFIGKPWLDQPRRPGTPKQGGREHEPHLQEERQLHPPHRPDPAHQLSETPEAP